MTKDYIRYVLKDEQGRFRMADGRVCYISEDKRWVSHWYPVGMITPEFDYNRMAELLDANPTWTHEEV